MNMAQWLIFFGIALIVVGALIWWGLPLGKLPGDVHIEGEKTQFYFPIVTTLIISVVLTVVLNLIFWMMRK